MMKGALEKAPILSIDDGKSSRDWIVCDGEDVLMTVGLCWCISKRRTFLTDIYNPADMSCRASLASLSSQGMKMIVETLLIAQHHLPLVLRVTSICLFDGSRAYLDHSPGRIDIECKYIGRGITP